MSFGSMFFLVCLVMRIQLFDLRGKQSLGELCFLGEVYTLAVNHHSKKMVPIPIE